MDKTTASLTTVFEKDSNLIFYNVLDNYWIYHKNVIEDQDEEKLNPADKAWLIVKYINNS